MSTHKQQGVGIPIVILGWKILRRVLVCRFTTDLMFALISNEELEELDQIAVKQLKNRYNDPTINKRFVIGVDRAKMKLFDVEDMDNKVLLTVINEKDR